MKKNLHFDLVKNDLEAKEAENYLLQSELHDTLQPSVNAFECIAIVIQMLSDLNLYIQKNGENEIAKKSKDRLNTLFNNLHELSSLTTTNHSLKLSNKFLHAQNNVLRGSIIELKKQLEAVNKTFNEL